MPRRDDLGRQHIVSKTVVTAGTTTNIPHTFSSPIAEIEEYSAFILGIDNNIVESRNIAGVANSDFTITVEPTQFEVTIPAGQTNIDGQQLVLYVIKKPNT
jgi:hypothetical protein